MARRTEGQRDAGPAQVARRKANGKANIQRSVRMDFTGVFARDRCADDR